MSKYPWLLLALSGTLPASGLTAQNVVTSGGRGKALPPVRVTADEALELLVARPLFATAAELSGIEDASSALAVREARARLPAEVDRYLAGEPFLPWIHVLGIAGEEVYFDHPATTKLLSSAQRPGGSCCRRGIERRERAEGNASGPWSMMLRSLLTAL
jgi:hypothetical protein